MQLPNTRRFFVEPSALRDEVVQIRDSALAHQLARVLRLGPGDQLLLLDGQGLACLVELRSLGRDELSARVIGRERAGGEPPVELNVFIALMRAERFEWALQKAVELGARRVVPVQFARSLPAERADASRLERWRRIAREAAEQACRGLLPVVDEPCSFADACAAAAASSLALILWEGEAPHVRTILRSSSLVPAPLSLALLSGPVGGIESAELTEARERGIIPVSLGPRILRAETAPVAALAVVLYELEL
jgi:16S rRNA (uracil1498-N3)-methyltransferase